MFIVGMYVRILLILYIFLMFCNNMYVLNFFYYLFIDFIFSLFSFFSGKGLDIIIKSFVGVDIFIEDLWLNFFCCSINLNK